MEKSGVSAKRSSAPPATEHGLARHWDLLVLLLLIVVSVPGAWLSPKTLVVVRNAGLIDDNWHLDEIFKLSRGLWVGRDVAFTHGPIFQWLSAVPARTMGISMGAIYGTWFVMLGWSAFVFTFRTLRRLLPEQPAWKRALPLLFLCLFWAPNLRTSFPILLFAFLLSGWYGVAEGRRRPLVLGAVAASLCGVGVLIASDTGIYSIAAVALSLAGAAFEFRRDGRALVRFRVALAAFVVASIVVVVLINALMARPLDFRFWKESAEMVSVYRWATPFRMTSAGTFHLLGALLGGAAIFLLRTFTRREGSTAMTQRTGFLAGAFVFALVMMQSGLVRSDYGHTVTAVLAMVVFSAAILFSFEGTRAHALMVLVALGCSTLFGELALRPSSIAGNYEQALSPLTECPAGFREYDRGCFQRDFAGMLEASSGYLHEHSSSQDSILVFPYQTLFGIATQRNVAGGLIQPYTASGDYLAQLEIAGLERGAAPAGLYLPDADLAQMSQPEVMQWSQSDLSLPVDGVANFTRTPEVWFWLFHHYRADRQLAPGVFGVLRDESRAGRISIQPQPLGLEPQTFPVRDRSSVADLGAPIWPSGFDFLRLRLSVRYSFWWKLRKPERMQLEITRADGSTSLQWFVLEPNVSSEVWFYPWSPTDLAHYFDADPGRWRPGARPAITRLRILATPWDWVSVTPEAIVVEAADAVRIDLSQ